MRPLALLRFASALPVLAAVPALHAQAAAYGTGAIASFATPSGTGSGNLVARGISPGFMVGGFYDFVSDERFHVGVDVRALQTFNSRSGTMVAGALRLAYVPYKVRLRPYLELGGGIISTASTPIYSSSGARLNGTTSRSVTFQLAFGLDIRLTDHLDLRALDYGVDAGPYAGVVFANSGVVYHFKLGKH